MSKRININKSPTRTSYQPVSTDEIECLIVWPEGSVGEREERHLLHTLINLANIHGYGRLSQLAAQLEDIWRNPEAVKAFEKGKKAHIDMMRE